MNKFSIVILAIIFSFNLSAQEILNEDFSTWLPEGWTVIDGPGSSSYSHWFHRDNQFATVYVTSDNQDEWLISPEFDLPTVGELRLSVDMMGSFYRMVTMDWGDLYVYASNDNGNNWDIIWKEDDQGMVEGSAVDWPYGNNVWFYPSISLNDYAGQSIQVAFRYVSPDGDADWWNLDNVIVTSLDENDVVLEQFEFPEYGILNDAFSFEGTFKNIGVGDVTSFEAIYSVNGVESAPYLVENLNIAYNTTYSFTHNIPYTFTSPEIYDLSLKISKVNGIGDSAPENNILFRDISIATETVSRKPLFEVFTSSTCAPCASTNENIDQVLANNTGNYSLVKYQVYWPGQGDPYYIAADSIRVGYYNVESVPNFYSNGIKGNGSSFNQSSFNAATDEGAFVNMEMIYGFNGTNVNVELNITPTISILDASVHIAIVEKTTYNNVGSNGETEFHNVLMKMLPGPEGNQLSLETGTQVSITESANLRDTFIEEFDDLQVVAWVQDNETHYVLQSESSDLTTGVESAVDKNLRIYPNPSDNFLFINSTSVGIVKIHDINGKLIKELNLNNGCTTIDISDLQKGVYFLQKITNNYSVESFKLIKK